MIILHSVALLADHYNAVRGGNQGRLGSKFGQAFFREMASCFTATPCLDATDLNPSFRHPHARRATRQPPGSELRLEPLKSRQMLSLGETHLLWPLKQGGAPGPSNLQLAARRGRQPHGKQSARIPGERIGAAGVGHATIYNLSTETSIEDFRVRRRRLPTTFAQNAYEISGNAAVARQFLHFRHQTEKALYGNGYNVSLQSALSGNTVAVGLSSDEAEAL